MFGKTKKALQISPKKSFEGLHLISALDLQPQKGTFSVAELVEHSLKILWISQKNAPFLLFCSKTKPFLKN